MQSPKPPHSHALRKGRFSKRNRIYLCTFQCLSRRPLLANPILGQKVADEIHRLDQSSETKTFAYVVMPDHVHWLFELLGDESLSKVVKLLKGRSARKINADRGGTGRVWQPGFHDRALRRVESLRDAGYYLINNPVRAGLVEHWRDYSLLFIDSGFAAEAAPTR